MGYQANIFIATIVLVTLDAVHLFVGIATSAETHQYREFYHPTWIMNVLSTVVAAIATGVGIYTVYRNYKNDCDLKKKRAYDIFNVFAGLCIFIGLISAGNTRWSEMAHMYFNYTAVWYVIKVLFSATILGARYYYLNFHLTTETKTSAPAATPATTSV
ncbi:MAG: hypothetical protein Hyperionvirus23_8 [Hyperionvirus sp.]|uniref:Uncharacterized protein n=1 Tax=Hyperionvirus sp. TaxID=2487770 RepID=A0A3G5ADJ5_9VIRU|nr:MAG: hypothetical protein Hyperionvirus23_8 [Hyperionvirus sp.]